jgi:NADPH2:quinone reductase
MPLSAEQTIRALVCRELADDLSGVGVQALALPPPRAGQTLVRVRAAALNFPDLLMTRGGYQHRPELPFVIGMEGAGEVVTCGSRDACFNPGDKVCFHGKEGACATHVVVDDDQLAPMPAGFDFARAAAYQVGSLTAYVALVHKGRLEAGETLLVHGATGGMGVAAVQLGRHLGATVIATGTSAGKLALLRGQGIEHCLELAGGFRDRVMQITGGRGVDVVFDPVGGDVFDESLRVMAWDGRLLVVGFASGRIPVAAANKPLIKCFSIIGVRAGETGRRQPDLGRRHRLAIRRLAEVGAFDPVIGARFGLEQGLDALMALQQRGVAGKIVIEMNP